MQTSVISAGEVAGDGDGKHSVRVAGENHPRDAVQVVKGIANAAIGFRVHFLQEKFRRRIGLLNLRDVQDEAHLGLFLERILQKIVHHAVLAGGHAGFDFRAEEIFPHLLAGKAPRAVHLFPLEIPLGDMHADAAVAQPREHGHFGDGIEVLFVVLQHVSSSFSCDLPCRRCLYDTAERVPRQFEIREGFQGGGANKKHLSAIHCW